MYIACLSPKSVSIFQFLVRGEERGKKLKGTGNGRDEEWRERGWNFKGRGSWGIDT